MKFNLPVAAGIVVLIIAAATAGMVIPDMMATETVLQMVVPSMVIFAAIVFLIGVKHGEYRATSK